MVTTSINFFFLLPFFLPAFLKIFWNLKQKACLKAYLLGNLPHLLYWGFLAQALHFHSIQSSMWMVMSIKEGLRNQSRFMMTFSWERYISLSITGPGTSRSRSFEIFTLSPLVLQMRRLRPSEINLQLYTYLVIEWGRSYFSKLAGTMSSSPHALECDSGTLPIDRCGLWFLSSNPGMLVFYCCCNKVAQT